MLYLVPSWNTQIEEFTADPIISLYQIFQDHGDAVNLMMLDFRPLLRYQLNVNNLSNASYWCVWDDILNITVDSGMPLSIEDIDLPDGSEFTYSAFSALVYLHDQYLAEVKFSKEHFVDQVIFEQLDSQLTEIDQYDDRGFIACKKYVDGNQGVISQIWFNQLGVPILKYNRLESPSVQVLNDNEHRFDCGTYDDINDVIMEFTQKHLRTRKGTSNPVILADFTGHDVRLLSKISHIFPVNLLSTQINDPRMKANQGEVVRLISDCSTFFVDSQQLQDYWHSFLKERKVHKNSILGYPYATELRLGESNEEEKMPIYWHSYTDQPNDRATVVRAVLNQIINDEQYFLVAETGSEATERDISHRILEILREKFSKIDISDDEAFFQIVSNSNHDHLDDLLHRLLGNQLASVAVSGDNSNETDEVADKNVESEKEAFLKILFNIHLSTNFSHTRMLKQLNHARVLVDVGSYNNRYLLMQAVSAGVPLILKYSDEMVKNKGNGWILSDEQSLNAGLDYFLQNLRHWNQSLVDSTKLIGQYTVDRQYEYWKGRLLEYGE
ncbi:MAG TPA: accessory Sec system protein Asp1 [Lactobacillus sp.]|nr:accessory Sec system protein Asp1 [Lactobacillus sp.]